MFKRRREVLGWAMYDFASSAFITVIVSVVFSTFFSTVLASDVALFGRRVPGESLWAFALALSAVLVALTGPVFGALADASGRRKRFLIMCAVGGSLATCLMTLLRGPQHVWQAFFIFVAANFAFSAGQIFYNAFLPEISEPSEVGRVSGFGWAAGYLGGGMLLALSFAIIEKPGWFGISDAFHWPVRLTFLLVGIWWLVFSLPTFLILRENPRRQAGVRPTLLGSLREVVSTLRHVRQYPDLFRFLIGYFLYNDGIATTVSMSAVFAQKELGMTTGDIAACFLMIQGIALAGALIFGYIADRVGKRRAILGSFAVWICVLVCALVVHSSAGFWGMGAAIGLVLGGTQAASRSLMSEMTPKGRSAEFFGFYSFSGKLSSAIGPALCALVSLATGNLRLAIFSLILLFIIGGILLWTVDEKRAMAVAAKTAGPA